MPKAKLSQIAATWVDEDHNTKKNKPIQEKNRERAKKPIKPVKKKQTFNLKEETINRLWAQRVKTGKTISKIIDELVDENLPKEKN